jgi:phosphatidylethanolamine/phosphatidyl-N-methylethanolamine N-methyltransferase
MRRQGKKIRLLPDYETMRVLWTAAYESNNYANTSLSTRVLSKTHSLIEREFSANSHFREVIEIGAGTGAHLHFIRHGFDRYVMSDISLGILKSVRIPQDLTDKVEISQVDAKALPYPDDHFDRLIATHVLEHIAQPQTVLQEWARVVRPGGVMSIILPCDPGFLWRLGRAFGPRKAGEKAGLPYDYYMAIDHINPIQNLEIIIDTLFPEKHVRWWPFGFVPLPDVNLIYAVNISL